MEKNLSSDTSVVSLVETESVNSLESSSTTESTVAEQISRLPGVSLTAPHEVDWLGDGYCVKCQRDGYADIVKHLKLKHQKSLSVEEASIYGLEVCSCGVFTKSPALRAALLLACGSN